MDTCSNSCDTYWCNDIICGCRREDLATKMRAHDRGGGWLGIYLLSTSTRDKHTYATTAAAALATIRRHVTSRGEKPKARGYAARHKRDDAPRQERGETNKQLTETNTND